MKSLSCIFLVGILFLLSSCKSGHSEVSKGDVAQVENTILSSFVDSSRYDTLAAAVGHQDTIIDQTVIEQDSFSEKHILSEKVIKPVLNDNYSPINAKRSKRGKFVFEEETFDFGFIEMGEEVDHSFSFKNVGDQAISISNVKASCGCTMPSYPFIPIEPGENGKIDVHFDSKGRLGRQTADVTIYIEGESEVYNLSLKGVVSAPLASDVLIDSSGNE